MINSNKQIKIGAILSYFSIILNIVAGVFYTPWMIKEVGDSQYGIYTLATSLIALFIMDFGLSATAARYVSNYRAEGNQEKVNSFLGVIYKIYGDIDLIFFVILTIIFIFLESIYTKLTPTEISQFKVVYLLSASFTLVNLPFVTLNGILIAYEKFIQLKVADVLYRVLLVGLTILGLMLDMGLYALVGVHVFAGLAIIVFKLVVIKKTTPIKVNFAKQEKSFYKEVVAFSIWVAIEALAYRLIFVITPTILGMVANSLEIAVFGVVNIMHGYVFILTTAISGMFMPRISKIYTEEEPEKKIMPLMVKVGKFQFALTALIVVGVAVLGKSFFSIWLRGETGYENAYLGLLLVIAPGLFFNSPQIANTALTVNNKVKYQALATVVYGVFNVVLSFILSSFYGMLGACIAICASFMLRNVLYHVIYRKHLKIDIWHFIKHCYLRMMPSIIVTLAVGFIVNYFIADKGLMIFMLKGAILVCAFVLSLLFLCYNKAERKEMFERILGKLKRKKQK